MDNKYELVMSNGDRAEVETVEALLLAARTLRNDGEGLRTTPAPARVYVHGVPHEWAFQAVKQHLSETVLG